MTRPAEVHFHDISARPVFISRFKAVRRNQRIFKAQSERQAFARAGATQRHPVPVDAEIDRTVHHCIDQNPTPFSSQSRGMLFRFCSGRKSNYPHSNSRAPNAREQQPGAQSSPGPHARLLTLQHGP